MVIFLLKYICLHIYAGWPWKYFQKKKLTVIAFRERNRKALGRDGRESGFCHTL